jgi:hypothetical protein
MTPDFGVARERSFSVPQLMRAVYGVCRHTGPNPRLAGRVPGSSCSATHTFGPLLGQDFAPALLVLLRRPWHRMHAAFWNGDYPHYRSTPCPCPCPCPSP